MKRYQIIIPAENRPDDKGYLIAEFFNWIDAARALQQKVKIYPGAYIKVIHVY